VPATPSQDLLSATAAIDNLTLAPLDGLEYLQSAQAPASSIREILVPETPETDEEGFLSDSDLIYSAAANLHITASAIERCALLPSQKAASIPPASPDERISIFLKDQEADITNSTEYQEVPPLSDFPKNITTTKLELAADADKYIKREVSKGTRQANNTVIRLFSKFWLELVQDGSAQHERFLKYATDFKEVGVANRLAQLKFISDLIFEDRDHGEDLSDADNDNVYYFVTTFVVRYRSKSSNPGVIHPATLKGYVVGLQRILRDELHVPRCALFKSEKLMTILDNRIRELQRAGLHGNSHNTLSIQDIQKIFTYLNDNAHSPQQYRNRLVFAIGLSTGLRPGAMHQLKYNQLKYETIRGEPVIMFYAAVGGRDGESKTDKGGFNTVADRPRVFPIPDQAILGGLVNLYGIIKEYLDFRVGFWDGSMRFFLSTRQSAGAGQGLERFFMKGNLGKNSFTKIVSSVCAAAGVDGDGANATVTTHGLRATMTTLLIDAGYDDSTISLRTGHRNVQSLRNYHSLRGGIGLDQFARMFDVDGGKTKQENQIKNGRGVLRTRDHEYEHKKENGVHVHPCVPDGKEESPPKRPRKGALGGDGTPEFPKNAVVNYTVHHHHHHY